MNRDDFLIGRRIRAARRELGLSLAEIEQKTGRSTSYLSLIENGKRHAGAEVLADIARALKTSPAELARATAPDERTALELELQEHESRALYAELKRPAIERPEKLPIDTLRTLVHLHREIARRERATGATPEEARRANTELRLSMRARDNYLPELEAIAESLLKRVGAGQQTMSALQHRTVQMMAEHLGFKLVYVDDLPDSTRSITDLKNGRIYLPPASVPGGHGLRSMALQAMAHRVLGHQPPRDYADFLLQRLEINYFAACCLMPGSKATLFLDRAKRERNLAVEDFRDAFGVTHESAALRMTNLATVKLGLDVHFLRVSSDGAVQKAYENDGLPLPVDVTGSVEGQYVCRKWAARDALGVKNRTTEYYQLTTTPAGEYWCATQTGSTQHDAFSITFGVRAADAKYFRGRHTSRRAESACPDPSCCKQAERLLESQWEGQVWPSARLHAHVLSPLPQGEFPGVDEVDVLQFLQRHAPSA